MESSFDLRLADGFAMRNMEKWESGKHERQDDYEDAHEHTLTYFDDEPEWIQSMYYEGTARRTLKHPCHQCGRKIIKGMGYSVSKYAIFGSIRNQYFCDDCDRKLEAEAAKL